jgi:hypothetical protein
MFDLPVHPIESWSGLVKVNSYASRKASRTAAIAWKDKIPAGHDRGPNPKGAAIVDEQPTLQLPVST